MSKTDILIIACLVVLMLICLYFLNIIDTNNHVINSFSYIDGSHEIIDPPPIEIKIQDNYFETLQTHNNDGQNVHNSQVIYYLKQKWKRLEEFGQSNSQTKELIDAGFSEVEIENVKIDETFRQINQAIKDFPTERKTKIELVLKEINKGNTISSISYKMQNNEPVLVKENWILTLVWERIHHPDNKENQEKLQDILLDLLYDCISNFNNNQNEMIRQFINNLQVENIDIFYILCINGRVSRILSIFTLIDPDNILSEPIKDDKELANLIYMKVSKMLNDEIKNQNLEKLFEKDVYTPIEKEKIDNFEKYMKLKIEKDITQEYKDIIPIKQLTEIIRNAQQGV